MSSFFNFLYELFPYFIVLIVVLLMAALRLQNRDRTFPSLGTFMPDIFYDAFPGIERKFFTTSIVLSILLFLSFIVVIAFY